MNAPPRVNDGTQPKKETDGITSSFLILNNTHRPKHGAVLVKMPVTKAQPARNQK
jgi:hypothetical protein